MQSDDLPISPCAITLSRGCVAIAGKEKAAMRDIDSGGFAELSELLKSLHLPPDEST